MSDNTNDWINFKREGKAISIAFLRESKTRHVFHYEMARYLCPTEIEIPGEEEALEQRVIVFI